MGIEGEKEGDNEYYMDSVVGEVGIEEEKQGGRERE